MKFINFLYIALWCFSFEIIGKDCFIFKEAQEADFVMISQWLSEAHVAQWWPTPKENESFVQFKQRIRSNSTHGFIVICDNFPIGYIQYYLIDANHEKTGLYLPNFLDKIIGFDQFIGDLNYVGKGYGTVMMREFIDFVSLSNPEIKIIIVDPDSVNYGAIRCYEKVGFKRVDTFETSCGDCLLMQYDIVRASD